eukprot:2086040-Rhodomonas_salina.1
MLGLIEPTRIDLAQTQPGLGPIIASQARRKLADLEGRCNVATERSWVPVQQQSQFESQPSYSTHIGQYGECY